MTIITFSFPYKIQDFIDGLEEQQQRLLVLALNIDNNWLPLTQSTSFNRSIIQPIKTAENSQLRTKYSLFNKE